MTALAAGEPAFQPGAGGAAGAGALGRGVQVTRPSLPPLLIVTLGADFPVVPSLTALGCFGVVLF